MGEKSAEVWRPSVGELVDSYHLEEKLGEGGFGSVYRAHRGGRLYAVKFLSLAWTDSWAWRELEVMLRLREVGGVKLEAHGTWPVASPRYLYIVMEYVRGRTLYDWAKQENPSARRVAEVLLPLARYLADVHAVGVVHRDLKGENILVREDGRPVLVDFGVGTYEGARAMTGWRVPGTRSYQSPEAIRFMRQRRDEEDRYPPTPGDDVWALGVVLYTLLTDALPFVGAYEGELAESIVSYTPEPPHERNPRVPGALSELCLHLLEKEAGARLGDAKALGEALEAVLAGADAAWDVPLCEACAPDNVTTARDRKLAVELEAEVARMQRVQGCAPRRGPLPSAPESSSSEPPRPSAEEPPVPEEAEAWERPAPGSPRARDPAWRWAVWVGVGWVLILVVLLAAVRALPAASPDTLVVSPAATPPVESPVSLGSDAAAPGQEVAAVCRPPEGDEGAAPPRAATPAPVASATHPEDSTRVKTFQPQLPSTSRKNPKPRTVLAALGKAGVMGAAVAQTACSGPQVRPAPPPESCPPGAVDTMKRLKAFGSAGVELGEEDNFTTVREGPGAMVRIFDDRLGIPAGTVLTGRYFIGQERVYGRFTQALLPGGETFPVCFQLTSRLWEETGVKVESRPGPDTAVVHVIQGVRAVRRFE